MERNHHVTPAYIRSRFRHNHLGALPDASKKRAFLPSGACSLDSRRALGGHRAVSTGRLIPDGGRHSPGRLPPHHGGRGTDGRSSANARRARSDDGLSPKPGFCSPAQNRRSAEQHLMRHRGSTTTWEVKRHGGKPDRARGRRRSSSEKRGIIAPVLCLRRGI